MEPVFEFRERFDTDPEIVELARQAVATLFGRAPQKKCVMLCSSSTPGTLVKRDTSTYQNEYDQTGQCAEKGSHHEMEFCTLMSRTYGWDVVTTTANENKKHIDCVVSHCVGGMPSVDPMKHYRVDVKGIKKINRTDQHEQDDLIWVELENKFQKPGWLYSQNTDWIAFRCVDHVYLLVELSELVKLVHAKCNLNQVVDVASHGLYKKYKRHTCGKYDYLTLLSKADVEEIALAIITIL